MQSFTCTYILSRELNFIFVSSALPIRPNSVIAVNTQPETILTVDGIESLNTYANGAATIGLRVSGNLRGKFAKAVVYKDNLILYEKKCVVKEN